jgi:hypothetical protein
VFESLPFKRIVEVRIQTTAEQHRAGKQVQGQQQGPPALVLPDMHVLVGPAAIEATLVAAKNHVTQRHGRRGPAKEQSSAKEKPDKASLNLDDAPDQGYSSAREPGHWDEEHSQKGGGQRPQVMAQLQCKKHCFLKNILLAE